MLKAQSLETQEIHKKHFQAPISSTKKRNETEIMRLYYGRTEGSCRPPN